MIQAACMYLALAAGAAPTPQDPAGVDPFERRTLGNGVELCVLQIEDAPRQAIFTFLPLGLTGDAPGQAQFSHLVEHMLIRSSDPDGLEVDGIRINGETTGEALRLETIAPPDAWREALRRHPRWLATRAFESDVLAREKARIAAEEESTVAAGGTAKWAQAAWGQVVRGGLAHAAVHGDVADCSVEELAQVVAERVRLGPGVRIVACGPVAADALEEELERAFGQAEPARTQPPAELRGAFQPGLREATWDLDAAHYLEWYELPAATPADAAFAVLLESRVNMALFSSRHPALKGGRALASTSSWSPGSRALTLSVALADDVELESLQAALRAALEPLREDGAVQSLALAKMQYAFQLGTPPDYAALRERFAGSPAADMIEAQTALTWSMLELSSGLRLPELAAALNALDLDAHGAVLAKSLALERRCALLLEP